MHCYVLLFSLILIIDKLHALFLIYLIKKFDSYNVPFPGSEIFFERDPATMDRIAVTTPLDRSFGMYWNTEFSTLHPV